jgi:hypothetical protein
MPTRNVNLTDELDRFVAKKVKSGRTELRKLRQCNPPLRHGRLTSSQAPYCNNEKVSCNLACELLPTQTSKSEGSMTQPSLAALQ